MFKVLFKFTSFTFITCLVLILGYTLGREMWLESEQWYLHLLTILTILTFEFGCFTVLEYLWKTF